MDHVSNGAMATVDSANRPHVLQPIQHSATSSPSLTIIVPTRNEADNIAVLIRRLEQALCHVPFEVLFVDDSDDETVATIETVRERTTCDVRVIHRPAGERHGGLGGAVTLGLRDARAAWACVMDADLQHPPEMIPALWQTAHRQHLDLVVASRYAPHGDAAEFSTGRALISRVFTGAARLGFARALRGVSDPMSGFFLVRRQVIDVDRLRPQGFKILLELLVRTPGLRVGEVGFHFGKRLAGDSKASWQEGVRYLSHLARLIGTTGAFQFGKFLLVGLSGLIVNLLAMAIATEMIGVHYLLSAILATQVSTAWNFALTEAWVFSHRSYRSGRGWRLAMFLAINNAAFLLRGPMIVLLTAGLGLYYLLSNLVSLATLTVVRYAVADNWIWGRKRTAAQQFSYDIHGIITVQSDVWLPELERFLSQTSPENPTIRVRIGKLSGEASAPTAAGGTTRHISYNEGLGLLGFAADVTIGDTVDITASAMLRHSPHVLYTNVVEPILRWTFVERGFALVHGACITVGNRAYLVTARTDTGKTTTMLRILDQQRRATDAVTFMSDDLTLVSPQGEVFTYPKPLTISNHTVRAINSAMLSWRERVALPFQSRIHSRSGRRFAFLLTQTKLPVATINTIVQFLVPPPKYHVQRLVPHAKVSGQAKLAGMFVIERGGDGELALDGREAFNTLMANSEDAYGFPPYPTIKQYLYSANGRDLRAEERTIVAAALSGQPALLLRSTRLDWAQRILTLLNATHSRHSPQPAEREPVAGVSGALGAA